MNKNGLKTEQFTDFNLNTEQRTMYM